MDLAYLLAIVACVALTHGLALACARLGAAK